jgi:hypothetical protein
MSKVRWRHSQPVNRYFERFLFLIIIEYVVVGVVRNFLTKDETSPASGKARKQGSRNAQFSHCAYSATEIDAFGPDNKQCDK